MKHWVTDNAYTITAAVFVGVFLFGTFILDWGREDYAFGLLLFLIVTLGIRLDEISRAIGTAHPTEPNNPSPDENLLIIVKDMKVELKRIRKQLDALLAELDRDR